MTRRRAFPFSAILALALVVSPLGAQDARLSNDVDTTLITVGGRVRMTVMVEHAAGARVVWPDSLDLSPFEVLGAEALAPSTQGDRIRSGAVLTVTAFELGELEIPSFGVRVMGPGDASQTLSTDRFGIEVVSVGVEEGGDIRDIHGPLWIPVSVVRVSLWLLLAVAAALVGFWLYRRRRRGDGEVAAGPPPRPPHEIALEALARIESSPMLEHGEVKEYHIAVSEAVRTYVEARFQVPALEMTTREVVTGLRRSTATGTKAATGDFIDGLARFLDQCDMVKFAKVRPGVDASRAVLVLGRDLVEMSAVQEDLTAEEAGDEADDDAGDAHAGSPGDEPGDADVDKAAVAPVGESGSVAPEAAGEPREEAS